MHTSRDYFLYRCCVEWPHHDIKSQGGLVDLIFQQRAISRRTFLRHVNPEDLAGISERLGYVKHPRQGVTMASDYHVSYFRSSWHGRRVYGFTHSSIEYVFVKR